MRPRSRSPAGVRFDRLRLRNVRCFEDAEVALDSRVTVIIGENGSGKTTIAEAVASLSAGDHEGLASLPLRHGAREGSVTLFDAGSPEPAATWSTTERRRLPESRYLFAYGRYRRVQPPEAPRGPVGGPEILGPEWDDARTAGLEANLSAIVSGRRTTTLFRPDTYLLRDIGRSLVDLHRLRRADPRCEAAWQALDASVRALGHALQGLAVIERDGRDLAVVRRRGLDLDLRELSDGYQAILVIVLDLLIRSAFLPLTGDPTRPATTIVVDEVDLHLHPRWQRRVVRQLTRLFPEAQIVLTTHSPAVVQGAIDDGHAVLILREKTGTVAPLTAEAHKALRGAQLGSILVDRHLFGVGSRYSARFEAVEKDVRRLRKKLETGTATVEDRQALLADLDRLEELMADEEARWAKQPLLGEMAKVQLASLRELAKLNEEARRGAS
jgi:AAA domain, putative AbiEii toxin, Type IV TA system/AAA domain